MAGKTRRELPVKVVNAGMQINPDSIKIFAQWFIEWGIREGILPSPGGYKTKLSEVKEV